MPDNEVYAPTPEFDRLAREAAGETVEVSAEDELPEVDISDAPRLRSFHKLGFRKRGRFIRRFKDIQPRLETAQDAQDAADDDSVDFDAVGDIYEVLADVEELLADVALSEESWEAWEGRFDEQKIMALLQSYMKEYQTGEASSSSS